MSEQATLYAPVINNSGDGVQVNLAPGHPGYHDTQYRAHRNRIAEIALGYRSGEPVPAVGYSEEEHGLWRLVFQQLTEKHHQYACKEYLEGIEALDLPQHGVPQLGDVGLKLQRATGFRLEPVASLVPIRAFYGSLEDGVFQATQYIRHRSIPMFSPEPDMIHEVVGHAGALASTRFADMYRLVGRTVNRLETDAAVGLLSRIFWFTMEYGIVRQNGELRAYGASVLSAYGELEQFQTVDVRPLSVVDMARQSYDVTHFQPVLFCAESMDEAEDFISDVCTRIDNDSPDRLSATGLL